jgi:hypothetical protein
MALVLDALRRVVRDITATTFPKVNAIDAYFLGIAPSAYPEYGKQADEATRRLTKAFGDRVEAYEKYVGEPLWRRADVPDVGLQVTPVQTLASIVSCQQGLRVNAEDIFKWKFAYATDIEPRFEELIRAVFEWHARMSFLTRAQLTRLTIFFIFVSMVAGALLSAALFFFGQDFIKPIGHMNHGKESE